jgi:hypothetical protein
VEPQWAAAADGMGLDEVAAVIDVSRKSCAQKASGLRVVVVLVIVGEVPRDIDERLNILRKRVDLDAKVQAHILRVCYREKYGHDKMIAVFVYGLFGVLSGKS